MLSNPTLKRILGSVLLLVCPAVSALADWHKSEEAIMGTSIVVELWHRDAKVAKQAMGLVMDEMRRIDREMSPYKPESELSRINRDAAARPVSISPELEKLILKSFEVSRLTQGAFDITFASVGRFYDYRKRIAPSEKIIRENLPNINYKLIQIDKNKHTIKYLHKGVYIDLGGIAKGHAVDRCIDILKKTGITHAIVTAGGDSRILGDRLGKPWMVGIRNPRKARSVSAILPLTDAAISTSGDYERYFIRNGVHYHHILNPGTGKSAKKLISATILGPDATTTDALSTSVFILGPEKGMQLVESLPGIEAVLIDPQGKMLYSSGLLQKNPQKADK